MCCGPSRFFPISASEPRLGWVAQFGGSDGVTVQPKEHTCTFLDEREVWNMYAEPGLLRLVI